MYEYIKLHFDVEYIYSFVWWGVCKQSRWRHSVTEPEPEPSQDGGYVLLWQSYDNNKMVAMRYYGNVMIFYIFNSAVIDWTFFFCKNVCMLSWAVIFAELVGCDTLDDGCNGGLPENAYKATESLGGLETEKDHPYEGDDEKCHFRKSGVKVTIQGAVNITNNETQMAQWLYKNGPISIGINANAMQVIIFSVVCQNIQM